MIPEGWNFIALKNLALVERGKFSVRPRNDPKYFGGHMPFVQTGDVRESRGWIRTFSQTLNGEGLKVSRTFPPNTILITIAANIGEVGLTTFEVACPDSIVGIQTKSNVSAVWLMYALQMRKPDIESFATQNAQKNINLEILRPFQMLTPPFAEQRAIAAILSTWDEAITLTERLIAALRQRKQALMQMLLTGEVRFPGFEGEWEETEIGEVATVRRGASPRPIHDPKWFAEAGRAWIRIADVTASPTRFLNEASQYLSELGEQFSVKVDVGDLIMSIAATIGVPKIVNIPACIHDGFVTFSRYEDEFNREFLYHFLGFKTVQLANSGQPGTQKNINSELVRQIKVPLVSLEEQAMIADVLNQTDEAATILMDYLEQVRMEKRGLMQQLLTGAIRV